MPLTFTPTLNTGFFRKGNDVRHFRSRYEQVRYELSKEEAIDRIEKIYKASYDPLSLSFDVWDQLLACESIEEATPLIQNSKDENLNTKTSVYVNGNDTYKQRINQELTQSKLAIIANLKTRTYRTPPIEIARLLNQLFLNSNTKDGWWLYVAQHWPPRAITRVISLMIKQHRRGESTIKNPAGYFTDRIKHRKQRKIFTGTNGTRKQQ